MPQPSEVDALTANLTRLYEDAQRRIEAELRALAENPDGLRRERRLREMQTRIELVTLQVDQQARQFIEVALNRVYVLGEEHASYRTASVVVKAGGRVSAETFTRIDRPAVSVLANGLTDDLLEATQHVRDSTKRLVRDIIRGNVADSLITGKTAAQAARAVESYLQGKSIAAIIYRNGASHGVGDYARMAVRTVSALAYNGGTLDGAAGQGVEYFEVFDGPGCGLYGHGTFPSAGGMIITEALAREWPTAHPNCRRSFGPRPDVGASADAFGIQRQAPSKAQPYGYQPKAIQEGQTAKEEAMRPAQRQRQARLRKREALLGRTSE